MGERGCRVRGVEKRRKAAAVQISLNASWLQWFSSRREAIVLPSASSPGLLSRRLDQGHPRTKEPLGALTGPAGHCVSESGVAATAAPCPLIRAVTLSGAEHVVVDSTGPTVEPSHETNVPPPRNGGCDLSMTFLIFEIFFFLFVVARLAPRRKFPPECWEKAKMMQ